MRAFAMPPTCQLRKTLAVFTASLVLAAVGGWSRPAAAADESQPASTDCNRHCLLGILTTYTEALVDNDISRLAVSPQLRVTSNGAVITLGHGQVWGALKRIPYRHAFVDPVTGAAVFYGTLTNTPTKDAEKWWFYVVRLKIVRQQITEIEEVSYDGTLGGTPASSLELPHSIYDTYLPPAERSARAQLFAIADKYFDAVTGAINYHDVPWHPECQRIELGTFTVNSKLGPGSCGGEFKDPKMRWTVRNRRFYIADEERGVVLAIGNFMTPPELPNNNGSVVFEVFKIQDGLIRHIEAFFRGNGQLHSGWGDGPGS
jgi:hypothetical protein